ncbi:endo-1,4-D-glucanase [Vibrio rumoiensis 1S-45]|uniref:cellulase n=2 Tax=Vibrio rumoiensis TaxID=76258 RepID=A0A1E5E3Z6_9VIBR|nr:cellulose synthase complex periplasmic endoglucanase BcsZ [Vibrio rumoiensis]OEF27290.1 endo-1,4-D-glucanase [Vibrio rumoiensis 1S-45]
MVASAKQCQWPMWQSFKKNYVQNGRVIDSSDPRSITTSEGQSYGLFFALIANDQKAFEQMLNWTEKNLSGGDLTARLPAWLWGTLPSDEQGVLDTNTASDSDLWIAYSLVEAGRLWNNYYYQTLGHSLAARILKEETAHVDNYGTVLLPGRTGFVLGDNHVRLNPSYVPLQLLVRMQDLYPDYQWKDLITSSNKLLLESMPEGFSPDWVEMTPMGIQTDDATQGVGSYNAIRTYLWVGMLPENSPYKKALISTMQPLVDVLKKTNAMPETFDTIAGSYKGNAGVGLTAAVIPLLQASGQTELAQQFASRTKDNLSSIEKGSYYQSVLTLFAQGWHNGRYQFDATGKVTPDWVASCQK